MKPPPFRFAAARSLDEVFALLDRHGEDAQIIAGGQSLMALLNMRLAAPEILVDINTLPGLSGIRESGGSVEIGALTRHVEVERSETVARHLPLLAEAMPHVAHPAIRNRGTIGGSVALADPAAEIPACCLALEAEIHLAGAGGTRTVPAADYFLGTYETARRPDEILTAIRFPKQASGEAFCFQELARRRGDYAMAGLAARRTGSGPRLVFFGVGDRPVLATGAMASGNPDAARAALAGDLDPPDDPLVPAAMRAHLAGVLLTRAWERIG